MAASISPGAKRKIPVPDETGKFQEKSLDFSPKQGKYNTILDNLSIGRYFPKSENHKAVKVFRFYGKPKINLYSPDRLRS